LHPAALKALQAKIKIAPERRLVMSSRESLSNRNPQDPLTVGQAALEESRFEDAINSLRSALRIGGRSHDEEALIRCLLSEALEKRGLHREQLEAMARYEKSTELARLRESSKLRVMLRLAWSYSLNNDVPRAIALFNQAMHLARRLEDHSGMGSCYFGLGRAYRNLSEIRIAKDHYSSALEHYRHTGDWRKLAESYISIGFICAYEGDFRSSLQALNQSLAIIGAREEHDLLGRAHMYLAITYDNLGSTSKALACWDKCLSYLNHVGNFPLLAINKNNLADKLIWLGEWERAETLAKEAIQTLSNSASVVQYGGAMDTLAHVYVLQGKLDEADDLLKESLRILSSVRTGEWAEVNTQITVGKSCFAKDNPEQALSHLNRATEICVRGGDLRFAAHAKLWLAYALLEVGRIDDARELVYDVRAYLRDTPSMIVWGLLMRMLALITQADGHVAAAIQALDQSSSTYLLRGNVYDCAVNRVLRARMMNNQGRSKQAIADVEEAISVFDRLGASIDLRNAKAYLQDLQTGASRAVAAEAPGSKVTSVQSSESSIPNLASALDGFVAQRLVQAAVSRDLLLHELLSIVIDQSRARAGVVAEISTDETRSDNPTTSIAASIGLDERQQAEELKRLSELLERPTGERFVYPLSDNQHSDYLMKIIDPRSERFLSHRINIQPLIDIVEQGLEANALKSRHRRTQVFDPAHLLSQVELPGFICASRAMSNVLEQIHKIRSSDVTVLITGESGTGKELIARAVHAGSSRKLNVFLPFNCSAAPHEMIESQLFGHRKGAFTGAVESNQGIIRAAERGTLFLDEIGDLPVKLQPKLLRFLQEGEIQPIGESQPQRVDVRVLAATNSDLERAVSEGRFREDLFHRLNVIRIHVPPLRQRREEIPALINYYLNEYQQDATKNDIALSEEAVDLMVVYDWPGNVRQLCNEVRRIVAYNDSGTIITPDGLSPEIVRASREMDAVPHARRPIAAFTATPETTLSEAVEELERRMIQDALRRSSGNIARAAKELGLSRKGLYLKMDRLNFNV
jgi:hydrogenase-4 transcriptional activator